MTIKSMTREEIMDAEAQQVDYFRKVCRQWKWKGRFVYSIRPPYCDVCILHPFCGRLGVNEFIQRAVMRGDTCPDFQSFWDDVFGQRKKR